MYTDKLFSFVINTGARQVSVAESRMGMRSGSYSARACAAAQVATAVASPLILHRHKYYI